MSTSFGTVIRGISQLPQMKVLTQSMEPAYRLGDLVSVSGGMQVKPTNGDDYVFGCTFHDGRTAKIVRRLAGETSQSWIVQQFNPRRTYRLAKSQWLGPFRVHACMRPRGRRIDPVSANGNELEFVPSSSG